MCKRIALAVFLMMTLSSFLTSSIAVAESQNYILLQAGGTLDTRDDFKLVLGTVYYNDGVTNQEQGAFWFYFVAPESGIYAFMVEGISHSAYLDIVDAKTNVYIDYFGASQAQRETKYFSLEQGKKYYVRFSRDRISTRETGTSQFAACSPSQHAGSGVWRTAQNPSCLSSGYSALVCEYCGGGERERQEIPATGHVPGMWVETIPATCTTNGQRTQNCTVCNAVLDSETTPAFGHDPADWEVAIEATCTENGKLEQRCKHCNALLDTKVLTASGHHYSEWETVAEATKQQEGEKRRFCYECFDTIYEPIPKLPKLFGIF